MNKSDKKKIFPGGIDEKAILDIVASKGSMLSILSETSPGPDTAEVIPPESVAAGKQAFTDKQCDAFIANFLNVSRSESTTTLHIDTDIHRRISSLVWGIGSRKVTVAGVTNRILALFFEQNEEMVHYIIEKHCKSFKTK